MDFENNISILSPTTAQPATTYTSLDTLSLRQQVMLNQFVSITGCNYEQAIELLAASNWQYQVGLSLFFDELSMQTKSATIVPCSTPVTPPNLDFLEKAFAKLSSSASTTNLAQTQTPRN